MYITVTHVPFGLEGFVGAGGSWTSITSPRHVSEADERRKRRMRDVARTEGCEVLENDRFIDVVARRRCRSEHELLSTHWATFIPPCSLHEFRVSVDLLRRLIACIRIQASMREKRRTLAQGVSSLFALAVTTDACLQIGMR